MRRRRPWRLPIFTLLLLAAVAAFGVGLFQFGSGLPRQADEPTRITDAIVVLTGGGGRIDRGLDLLAEGLSERLFISGVYRGVEVDELLELARDAPQELRCCIELGYDADNTIGNAREIAAWVTQEGIASLRLVTAAYHMPRARLELARTLPGMTILQEPVYGDGLRDGAWWRQRDSVALLSVEYLKYLVALVRGLPGDTIRRWRVGREAG